MSDQIAADLASLRIERDAPPPPSRFSPAMVVTVVACVAAASIVVALAPRLLAASFTKEVAITSVSLMSPAQASVDLSATGYVVPQVVVKVGAKISGRIRSVGVTEGGQVRAGAVLFDLDSSAQQSALVTARARSSAAQARAAAAQGRVAVAQAAVHETQLQFDRQAALVKAEAVSTATATDLEARLQSLAAQVRSADADVLAARADVAATEAEVRALLVDLANATVLAPCNGIAQTKPAMIGDVVSPATVLVELADPGSLLVEVDVPEAKLGRVRANTPCEVVLDALPDKRLRGLVVDVSPRLNRSKATGTAKVRLIDVPPQFLPEMAARVSFLAKALDPAELSAAPQPVIPASAIAERQGAKVAFEIVQGKLKQVLLVLGLPQGSGFSLKQGPAPGVHLVSNPAADLADGQSVKEKDGP